VFGRRGRHAKRFPAKDVTGWMPLNNIRESIVAPDEPILFENKEITHEGF
jgi:hypothetical protein